MYPETIENTQNLTLKHLLSVFSWNFAI